MGRQPHVLVIPFPAQGHVRPLMKLSNRIAGNGIKVTFFNTEVIQAQIMGSMQEEHKVEGLLDLISIWEGLEPEDERTDGVKFVDSLRKVVPEQLMDLINKINGSDVNEQISCVIADPSIGWTPKVATKLGVKEVAVWPAEPACLYLLLHIPELIKAGVIDENGIALKNELIRLSDDIPSWTVWDIPNKGTDRFKENDMVRASSHHLLYQESVA